ncbi:MAG: transglycosylase SLT domain-containing protein [Geothrix sp.]|nr:transglycosylase SLT domain-containing protein [Geothrix sp.]
MPAPSPQAQVATVPARAADSDAIRIQRLRALVEAAEMALEADEEETATTRSDEADVLTADWPAELLKQAEVQGLLQRLKDVQDQIAMEDAPEAGPGLKAQEEVVSISGDDLRAELERVRAAEQGATYDFPIDLNDKVLTWVNLFGTTNRGFMENALGRASMYMPMVRQVFAEEGVPSDLAYLAVIESGFRNEAKSRAKAVGMWQFIRSTGRIYGLTANAWVEERRDPVKATRASARYLKRLYEITGDWYLAASSYNAGPLTLERAIQNVGTRNFWDLARSRWLRAETKNYIPQLCAAILVGRNPERYGLRIIPLMPYAYETVTVSSMTSLTVLARFAGTDVAMLKALNPELLRGSTPPGSYLLRVPPGKAMDCLRQLAGRPVGKRPDFQGQAVRKGDTLVKALSDRPLSPLPAVPRDLGGPIEATTKPEMTPQQLSAVSQTPASLAPPATGASTGARNSAVPSEPEPRAYSVLRAKQGDTLAKLARVHKVSLGELMRLNPDSVKALHPGDEVRLPGSVTVPTRIATAATAHRVQKGETLASIARKYGVATRDLKAWNRLKGDRIQAGQRLRLSAR